MSWEELKELNYEILNNINELNQLNRKIFYDDENIEAFCYLNLDEYERAITLFEEKGMYNEIGDILILK